MALTRSFLARHLFCLAAFLLSFHCAVGQVLFDNSVMNELFKARVKTFDEFLARFNGKECAPGVRLDDINYATKNILSVFDFSAKEDKKAYFVEILEFADSARTLTFPLCANDSLIFAEARCKVTYGGKTIPLNLVMKQETGLSGHLKWSIVGVHGFIDFSKIQKRAISPVENEINFVELGDCINSDRQNILSYASNSRGLDKLSYLFGLIKAGQVKFGECEQVVYHVYAVHSYYFTVKEHNRMTSNAGWLISSLQKMSDTEKALSIKQLLGIY